MLEISEEANKSYSTYFTICHKQNYWFRKI